MGLRFLTLKSASAGSAASRSSRSSSRCAASSLAGAGQRRASGVVPDRQRVGLGRIGRQRATQQRVPLAEAHEREVRQHRVLLHDRRARVASGGPAGRGPGGLGGLQRQSLPAGHRRRGPQEVVVVGHVADPVRTLCIDLRQITPIGFDGALVRTDRVVEAADPQVDVRRHVQQMAGTGDGVVQEHGAGQGASRMGRGFLQVDPVMVCARVAAIECHRPLEQVFDLGRPGACRAVRLPPVVGVQVQKCLGGEHRDVGVARVAARHCAHALRVGRLVDRAAARVAQRQRIDQRALHRRGAPLMPPRLAKGPLDLDRGFRAHVGVDVGPQRPGKCPPARGAGRVDGQCGLERTHGLRRIEPVDQQNALIDVAADASIARLGRPVIAVEAGQQRRHRRRRVSPIEHRRRRQNNDRRRRRQRTPRLRQCASACQYRQRGCPADEKARGTEPGPSMGSQVLHEMPGCAARRTDSRAHPDPHEGGRQPHRRSRRTCIGRLNRAPAAPQCGSKAVRTSASFASSIRWSA